MGSVAVIADAHIGGPGGPAGPLVAQLDELPAKGCTHLVLLGDLFHVWVGARQFETEDIREVVEALVRLRRRGVVVEYVEGNRDFFIDRGPYAVAFDRVAREVRFEAAGKRYLAVHGDGLNARDYSYRFWRWLSKSAPVRLAMLRLPGVIARRLVHSTEAQLAKSNFKHKSEVPEGPILDYVRGRLDDDFDVLLLGHFHEPRRWRCEGRDVVLLDAWYHSRAVEWLDEPGAA